MYVSIDSKNVLEKTSNVNYAGLVGFNFDALCARYKVGITYRRSQ